MKKKLGILALILAGMVVTACGKNNSASVSVPDPSTSTSTPSSVDTSNGSTSDPSTTPSVDPSTSTSTSIDTTVHVTGVNVDSTSLELVEGDTHQAVATVLPEDATDKSVTWSTSDENVATVSDSGLITAISEGSATITVTTTDGEHTATISVTVEKAVINVTSVSLNETDIEIDEGETATLIETVLPEDATDKSVTWSTGDEEVATVSGGVVTGVKEGSTTVTVTTTDGEHTATANVVVTKRYAISVNEAPGIDEVTVADKAKEGELVELTLSFNEDAIIVEKVMANDVVCGTQDGTYYFYMPAEAVEINVVTSTIGNNYLINNGNKNSVTLGKATAVAGEEVNLTFTLAPGYNFSGEVTVYEGDPDEAFTPITIDATVENGVIKFTMPENDVRVDVGVTRAYFRMTKTVDTYTHINTVYSDGSSVSASSGNYDIKFDSTVKIAFTQYDSYLNKARPVGIHIPEMNRTIMITDDNDANSVSFSMPYFDITIEVLTEKVYRNFTIQNSEHITVTAYEKVDDEYVALEENKAVYGDYVYLKAVSTDDEIYAVRSIVGTAYVGWDTTVTPTLEADGYYKFQMPEVKAATGKSGTLDFVVTEKDITLFAGEPFLGEYKGYESWNTQGFNTNKTLTLDGAGIFKWGSDEYTLVSAEDNLFTIKKSETSTGYAYYDERMVAAHYSISEDIYTSDMNFLFKVEAGDSLTGYAQAINSGKYHVGEIYKNGESLVNYFVDSENDILYTDVVFVFKTGQHVNDATVDYTIKDSEDNLIATVTGTTASNRTVVVANGLEGTYTVDDKDMVVETNIITYDGHEWNYSIIGDRKVKMQYTDEEKLYIMEVTLNEDWTATIDSSTIDDLPPVYLRAFNVVCTNNYNFHVYFKSADKAIVYMTYSHIDKIQTSASYGYDANATYIYDKVANTITLTSKDGTVVFGLNEEGAITSIVSGSIMISGSWGINDTCKNIYEFTPDTSAL